MPSLFFDKSRSSNGDSDIESHEGLLEANPRNASPWTDSRPQRGYPISKTILVLLLALSSGFMGAVIGVSWERRNTNSICIGLTSRPCKFYLEPLCVAIIDKEQLPSLEIWRSLGIPKRSMDLSSKKTCIVELLGLRSMRLGTTLE